MYKVAIIEDDQPTSRQLRDWVLSAAPDIEVGQWFTRDNAEAAIAREDYDLVNPNKIGNVLCSLQFMGLFRSFLVGVRYAHPNLYELNWLHFVQVEASYQLAGR
jgi:hypothetical protein